jgi:hypothetical protein
VKRVGGVEVAVPRIVQAMHAVVREVFAGTLILEAG